MGSGSLIPLAHALCGSIPPVSRKQLPSTISVCNPNTPATDPIYYVPLEDIRAGPGTIQDKSEEGGFWKAKLHAGHSSVDIYVLEKGVLNGFVKLDGTAIGKLRSTQSKVASGEKKNY